MRRIRPVIYVPDYGFGTPGGRNAVIAEGFYTCPSAASDYEPAKAKVLVAGKDTYNMVM